jgi:protein involved in polysaccharide export with SLBB domain/Flp pilus assembly protein TadD
MQSNLVISMKNVLLIGIFSLLVLTPFRCAEAQAGSNTEPAKAVEKSSGIVIANGESRIHDTVSEAAARNATARNQTSPVSLAEPAEELANALPQPSTEAERKYNAGVVLYNSGKLDAATSAFNETNRLKPNDAQTQYMLGMVYWRAQAFNNSVDSFKRAVRLKPDWAEAQFRLGLVYYVLGQKRQTNEVYRRLVELNSPLAAKFHRIYNDTVPASVDNSPKTKPPVGTTREPKASPVSSSAPLVRPIEKRVDSSNGSSGSSENAPATKNLTPVVVPASERRSPAIIQPSEKPSPAVTESNNATTTPVSSGLATLTATTSAKRTAGVDPGSIAKTISPDDSAPTDIYKVGVGDVLDIRFLNSPSNRSTLHSVIEGGLVDVPITRGPLVVAGLTTKDIQELITAELKRLGVEDRTQVSVGVRQYASHAVNITGLVGSPGTKVLRREAVPLYVLLAEVQPRLDAARATIMRAGTPTQVIDLANSAALNFLVQPGDVITLTARPQDFYYIGGRIGYPGQKPFQTGITLVQAILAAGGLSGDNIVELSREGADGRLITTKFKLKEIKSGKIQDPRLQPGDRIEVSH